MSDQQIVTIHGLRDLIERAIKEKARSLPITNPCGPFLNTIARGLAGHISKTIIGESFELELVRKMRPMVREHGALMRLIGSVAKDFLILEEDDQKMEALQGLRISPPKEEEERGA